MANPWPKKIAFDCTLMQPGCVLLQAAMGVPSDIAHNFMVEDWLLHPTPDMRVYPLANQEQLDQLIDMVKERRNGTQSS